MNYEKCLMRALQSEYNSYILPPIVVAQINKYHKNGMTYEGMYNTLCYLKENLNVNFEEKYGIGLVKYYYYKKHNYQRKPMTHDYKVINQQVNIKAPNKNRNNKLIDMEKINGD